MIKLENMGTGVAYFCTDPIALANKRGYRLQ